MSLCGIDDRGFGSSAWVSPRLAGRRRALVGNLAVRAVGLYGRLWWHFWMDDRWRIACHAVMLDDCGRWMEKWRVDPLWWVIRVKWWVRFSMLHSAHSFDSITPFSFLCLLLGITHNTIYGAFGFLGQHPWLMYSCALLALCDNNDMVIFLFYFSITISGSMVVISFHTKNVTEDHRVQVGYRGRQFWNFWEIIVTKLFLFQEVFDIYQA